MGTLRSLRTQLASLTILLLSTWISCSGGGPDPTPTPTVTTTSIGSSGGTITAPAGSPIAGTQVVIGSNSFIDPTATVNIGLGSQETLPKALDASTQAISCGKTLEIQSSSSMMVIKPMSVTMPYSSQGLNSNDVPCAVYYDPTRNEYIPVTVTGLDTNTRTISFYAYRMGKYSLIGIPGLGNTLSSQIENDQQKELSSNALLSSLSVDTGYKGEQDNFSIVNFGTYSSTEGSCVGMSSFAAWYYKYKKNLTGKGLFSQYSIENSREIAIRAQTFSNALYETALTISQSTISASTKAQMAITQLKLTNYPILVELRTSLISGSHCVMLFKYDDNVGRFFVYDPNMAIETAKDPRSFKWNKASSGSFSNYDGYSSTNQPNYYTFMEVFAPTSEFENIYQQSISGWNSSSFDKITITSPTIQSGKYYASSGQTKISINGIVSNTFQNSKFVHYLINNNYKTYIDIVGQSFSINNLDLKWKSNGECEIVLVTNKDKNNWASGQSAYYRFIVVTNQAPSMPTILGPTTLMVGQTGTYSLSSTDPDGDSITYLQSPAVNGVSISGSTLTFTPSASGSVTLSVIARDSRGVDSPAGTLSVTVQNPLSLYRIKQVDYYTVDNTLISSFRFSYPGNNIVRNDLFDPGVGNTAYWLYFIENGQIIREETHSLLTPGQLIDYTTYSLDSRGLPINLTYNDLIHNDINYLTQTFDTLKLKTQTQRFDKSHNIMTNKIFDYNSNHIRTGSRSYDKSNNFTGSTLYEYSNNLLYKTTSYSSSNVKGNYRIFVFEPLPPVFDLMAWGNW